MVNGCQMFFDKCFLTVNFVHYLSGIKPVQIYDGGSSDAALVGEFCGTHLPSPVISTSNSLFMRFSTDGVQVGPGFLARYYINGEGATQGNLKVKKQLLLYRNKRLLTP